MLLDTDTLDAFDRDILREVLVEPRAPYGSLWSEKVPPLEKLVKWASWGVIAQREVVVQIDRPCSPEDYRNLARPLRFCPDLLSRAEWELVEAIDQESKGPDGHPWPNGAATLGRLAAWAQAGRERGRRPRGQRSQGS